MAGKVIKSYPQSRPDPAQFLDKKYFNGISYTPKQIIVDKCKFNLFHRVTDVIMSIAL